MEKEIRNWSELGTGKYLDELTESRKIENRMEQIVEIREHMKKLRESWKSFKMPFGKYQGKSLYDIKKEDMQYLKWIADNVDNAIVKIAARKVMVRKLVKQ